MAPTSSSRGVRDASKIVVVQKLNDKPGLYVSEKRKFW